jgi:hydrogenase large subunit
MTLITPHIWQWCREVTAGTSEGKGEEVHILWTSEGMSCDGDSVSLTAAMQPSIEEVVLGVIPGLPSVPSLLRQAGQTAAPQANLHGHRTIADIMRAFNPFIGQTYKEVLQMSRLTREMLCLMEGRHVHPSTLYPGGVDTVATLQVFTNYLVRLMRYIDFVKKIVPMNDDLFNFFYEALPGYEEVGRRRILLGCWGSFQNPDVCDYHYETMREWERAMYVTPGVIVDGQLVTTDLVDINLGSRILLGSSCYEDWKDEETLRASISWPMLPP